MVDAITLMFTNRPPVVANLMVFAVIASAERGVPRMLLWLLSGTIIGWLSEYSSTHNGFPFGSYEYHAHSFVGELSVGGVPIFASISFATLTYFGFSVACTLLSPLRRTGRGFHSDVEPATAVSVRVLLLATVLTTWMDLVLDPVTLLGRHWHLGDLYHYDPPGSHFGVPLMNYFGWLLTTGVIIAVNQQVDRVLAARGNPARPVFTLPFGPLWSIGTQLGTYVHMLVVTFYLMTVPEVPPETPLVGILLSGLFFTAVYVIVVGLLLRRAASRVDAPIST